MKCLACNGWGDVRGTFQYCRECGGGGIVTYPPNSSRATS